MQRYVLTPDGWFDNAKHGDDNEVSAVEIEERINALEAQLAAEEEKSRVRSKVLKYVLFVLTGSDQPDTDLGNDVQLAADAAKDQLAERDREVEGLVKAFSHYHEAKYDINSQLTDQCKRCGLDIRNEVHIRTALATEETTHG